MNHPGMANELEWFFAQLLLTLPFVGAFVLYVVAVLLSYRTRKPWPLYRTLIWIAGCFAAYLAVAGPIAEKAHTDFAFHMIGHLLLGMLAPLLMALAAPVTLLVRTLPVPMAKGVSQLLRSKIPQVIADPSVASLLNIGALWLLYTTSLFAFMHAHPFLYFLIHIHVFLAGYMFTISMIYIDPVSHRKPFLYRAIVLVIALAGHGILSKWIYANPPVGVAPEQAQTGAMLMYYGGDAIDLLLLFIFCFQWYKATRRSARASLLLQENSRANI
ncbi:cytochrome c oxidase assembly protein [Shouchella clausii]|uniref:cytochrome c oxidase assembly protein n=1 Tax=Shouchella clausii TaxID=79880 RepID=UPI0021484B78|nr:cytochrome c oxidase assembly protein [Shouchella clausii]MCR1287414.1 cytochrome c oxidase assembly protein [Shouchella clausii]